MDEKEYISSLIDDKMLFDEILPNFGDNYDEELEEQYKSGIKYQEGLKNHTNKNQLR